MFQYAEKVLLLNKLKKKNNNKICLIIYFLNILVHNVKNQTFCKKLNILQVILLNIQELINFSFRMFILIGNDLYNQLKGKIVHTIFHLKNQLLL